MVTIDGYVDDINIIRAIECGMERTQKGVRIVFFKEKNFLCGYTQSKVR